MAFISNLFSGPPKPPSPERIAETQGGVSKEIAAYNAALNRVNQITPYGSVTYNQTGTDASGAPNYTATTALSPAQQALLNALQSNQGAIGGNLASLIANTSGMYSNPLNLPDTPDFGTGADSVVTQAMDRHAAYMDPYYTQRLENRENELVNRGLVPGSAAYEREMRAIRQSQDESRGQFLNTVQPLAFTQQQQQHMARVQEALQEYGIPLSTIQAFMGITQPGSVSPINVAAAAATTPDITKAFADQYNAQMQQYLQSWGALTGIGSAIAGLPLSGAGATTVGSAVGGNAVNGLSRFLGLV